MCACDKKLWQKIQRSDVLRRGEQQQSKQQGHQGLRWRGDWTHDKSLVEFGAKQAFLPVVADGTSHGLGDRLLDAKCDPRLVVKKLWVSMDAVSAGRWEARGGKRRRRAGGCGEARARGDGELPVYTGRGLGAPDGVVLVVRSPGGSGRRRLGRCRGRTADCRRGAQWDGRRGQRGRVMRSVAGGAQTRAGDRVLDGRRRRQGRAGHGGGRRRFRGGWGKRDGGLDVRDNARGQVRGWRRGC